MATPFSLQGTPSKEMFLWVPGNQLKKPCLDFEILPPADQVSSVYFQNADNLDHLLLVFNDERKAKMKGGVATWEVSIIRSDENMFKGTFQMKMEPTGKANLQKNFDENILPAMRKKFASSQELPEAFKKKSIPFKDKALSDEGIRKLIKQEMRDIDIITVKIDDNDTKDYTVQVNNLGNPIKQYTARNIFVAYKINGKCEYARLTLERPHLGGGKYGDFSVIITGDAVEIGCNTVK